MVGGRLAIFDIGVYRVPILWTKEKGYYYKVLPWLIQAFHGSRPRLSFLPLHHPISPSNGFTLSPPAPISRRVKLPPIVCIPKRRQPREADILVNEMKFVMFVDV